MESEKRKNLFFNGLKQKHKLILTLTILILLYGCATSTGDAAKSLQAPNNFQPKTDNPDILIPETGQTSIANQPQNPIGNETAVQGDIETNNVALNSLGFDSTAFGDTLYFLQSPKDGTTVMYGDKVGLVKDPAKELEYIIEFDSEPVLAKLLEEHIDIRTFKNEALPAEEKTELLKKIEDQKTGIKNISVKVVEKIKQLRGQRKSFSEAQNVEPIVTKEYFYTFAGIAIKAYGLSKNDIETILGVKNVFLSKRVKASLEDAANVISAPQAWQINTNFEAENKQLTGEGTVIAVIDTGVDYTHPDLGGCLGPECKVIGGYDFVNFDNNPMDDHGHGTHVAGIAAGNGLLMGIAKDAKILAYKAIAADGSGYTSDIIAAIEKAIDPNGDHDLSDSSDVINLSLGAFCYEYSLNCGPDDEMSIAVDNAVNSGVITVVAAGNNGPLPGTINSPGTARNAITVGATYKKNYSGNYFGDVNPGTATVASFSSRGPVEWNNEEIEKPDIVAPGAFICSARFDEIFPLGEHQYYFPCEDDKHVQFAGTSMATPMVAGLSALLKQKHPEWQPEQIKNKIKETAIPLSGYDLFDQGKGIVNSVKALKDSDSDEWYQIKPGFIKNSEMLHDPSKKFYYYEFEVTAVNNNPTEKAVFEFENINNELLSINPSNFSLQVGKKSKSTKQLTLKLNNDLAFAGNVAEPYIYATVKNLNGEILRKIKVDFRFKVKDFIMFENLDVLDFGVDEPALENWEKSGTIILSNARMDASQQVEIAIEGTDDWPEGIDLMLSSEEFELAPSESRELTLTISIPDNNSVPNGVYSGKLVVNSSNQHTELDFSFIKSYYIEMHFTNGEPVYGYAVNQNNYYKTWDYSEVNNQNILLLLLDEPGTYDVVTSLFDSEIGYFKSVVKEKTEVELATTIKISSDDANLFVQPSFLDKDGLEIIHYSNYIYGLLVASRLETQDPIGMPFIVITNSNTPPEKFYYSAFSDRHSMLFSTHLESETFNPEDESGVFIAFNKSGMSDSVEITTQPEKFRKIKFRNYPKNNFRPGMINSIKFFGPPYILPPGGRMYTNSVYVHEQPENGLGRFTIVNCYSDSRFFWCLGEGMDSAMFYVAPSGLKYNVGMLSFSPEFTDDPDMGQNQGVSGFDIQYWNGKFKNTATDNGVFASLTSYTNDVPSKYSTAYIFLTQHRGWNGNCTFPFSWNLYKDGELFDSESFPHNCFYPYISSYVNEELTEPGEYELLVEKRQTDSYIVYKESEKINLNSVAVSKFTLPENHNKSDFNPPSISFFRVYNDNTSSPILEPAPQAVNRLVFHIDPVGGQIVETRLDQINGITAYPFSNEQEIQNISIMDLGDNKFEAILPKLGDGEKLALKLFVADDSDNFLTYRFDIAYRIYCGNDTREPWEECDGQDLNGFTCNDFGFNSGDLMCNNECHFDTGQCFDSGACAPGHRENPDGTCTAELDALAADGFIEVSEHTRDWNYIRNKSEGNPVGGWNSTVNNTYHIDPDYTSIYRVSLPFDTSSIPDSGIVQSAELTFTKGNTFHGDSSPPFFLVFVPTSLENPPNLNNGDFDEFGTIDIPLELAERHYSDDDSYIPVAVSLNQSGIEYIDKDGFTILGVRGSYELSSEPPQGNEHGAMYYLNILSAENGYGYPAPKLIVNYLPE